MVIQKVARVCMEINFALNSAVLHMCIWLYSNDYQRYRFEARLIYQLISEAIGIGSNH